MYLKSLTLKGFKSFADSTTLEFEPGVTVVVGPNGSGKSNVVDAVAWVLGAQGPRVVRSQKMDDVIFAGTSKRAALGRAEVSLTIDNSSRRLPIDFNEVTITRTLFRSGESEYQLNGTTCRLLDIQELLSDSGVGRQQHVIVSQGQLDAVLVARPEDRRMVIEEAAGVLKYRRRRERAERRLEASETALARLQDLLREVRRQLKPLERQASSALRHEEIATEADQLRLYLSGQELRELSDRLGALHGEIETMEHDAESRSRTLSELDTALQRLQSEFDANRGADLSPLISRYVQLAERARGIVAFIAERRRARAELVSVIDEADSLVAMEDELHRVIADLGASEVEAGALAPEWEALGGAEQAHAEAEASHVERFGLTDAAEENEHLVVARAALASELETLAAGRTDQARATERLEQIEHRRAELSSEHDELAAALSVATARVADLRAEAETTANVAGSAARSAEEAEATLRAHSEASFAATARLEALRSALDEVRARAGVERLAGHDGVIGTFFDAVSVSDGYEAAFEAALEGLRDAVLVEGTERARAALATLREGTEGGAVVAVGIGTSPSVRAEVVEAPAATQWLRRHLRGTNPAVDAALDTLLGDVLVADEVEAAIDFALSHLDRTIVTTNGERFSPRGWRVGAAGKGATRAALDDAGERAGTARRALEAAEGALAASKSASDLARDNAERAGRALGQASAAIARDTELLEGAARRLGALEAEWQTAAAERDHLGRTVAAGEQRVRDASERLVALEHEEQLLSSRRAEAVAARRNLEERARSLGSLRRDLEVRAATLEERRSMLLNRRATLEERIASREVERARAEVRRSAHASEDLVLGRLGSATERLVDRLEGELARLSDEQHRRQVASQERLDRLGAVRRERETLEHELGAVRDRRQRCELDQTELRVRHEAAVDRLRRELDVEPEEALVAVAPELADGVEPASRLRELERELRLLGPVNPLAREELTALQERNTFLETQLEDVRTARRELNQVIHAIDAEIVEVFTAAYADVARHFSDLIATLFPGGSGRLELTAPDDLLATGVEIEARPAGRNVRRLSLLSGGERSLVAVAFLFAVFRSRPSPFYILDEVEAALDEVNLLRFLDLIEEFRNEAQLLIVSHQKKTMEVADALYGITMQPGGASKAVSEMLDRTRVAVRATSDVARALDLSAGLSEPGGLVRPEEQSVTSAGDFGIDPV